MKALILSDSHGWTNEIKPIIKRHRAEVDVMIHCGDSELSRDDDALAGLKVVKGNCDFGDDFPDDRLEIIDGQRIYITHGHLYNVKSTNVPLSYRAEEKEADIVCFGHSHLATAFEHNGVIYINPGSIQLPRGNAPRTYCICEKTNNHVTVTFYEKEGSSIENMIYTFAV